MNKKDKILITGSSGLLGSALVRCLNSKNYKNLLLINSKNTDLTDLKKVTKLIKKNNPKYIFHHYILLMIFFHSSNAFMDFKGKYFSILSEFLYNESINSTLFLLSKLSLNLIFGEAEFIL